MGTCESHTLLHGEPCGYLPVLVHFAKDGHFHATAAVEKLASIFLFARASDMSLPHALGEFDVEAFAFTTVGELVLLLLVGVKSRRAADPLDCHGGDALRVTIDQVLRSGVMLFYFIGTGLGQVAGPMMKLLALVHM